MDAFNGPRGREYFTLGLNFTGARLTPRAIGHARQARPLPRIEPRFRNHAFTQEMALFDPRGPIRFATPPEQFQALLGLLDATVPDWDRMASELLRAPGLLHRLFCALPLEGERLAGNLADEAAERLRHLGPELMQVWLLTELERCSTGAEPIRACHAHALEVADRARQLAHAQAYDYPDEAFLAGLWHVLPDLLLPPDRPAAPMSGGQRTETLVALATGCGVAAPLADAYLFDGTLAEQREDAHPLVGLLWSAIEIQARPHAAEAAAGLAGLAEPASQPSSAPSAELPSVLQAGSLVNVAAHGHNTLQLAALRGWIRVAFRGLSHAALDERFTIAMRLLCHASPPLIVYADENDRLRMLNLGGQLALREYFDELDQHIEHETSVIALALRSGTPTSRFELGGRPGRAVSDWHVARWLRRDGIVCVPLRLDSHRAAAIIGSDAPTDTDSEICRLCIELASEAANACLELEQQARLQARIRAELQQRFEQHARKIVHEANNPLTVLKSYLSVMPERHPEAGALGDEVRLLQDELDRLGALLRQIGQPALEINEAPRCDVNRLVRDMQALYAESLFGRRGIHFELRSTGVATIAAMPESVLKQVMINLWRNAAEALQPGKRFSLVLPGSLLVNGVRCIEIRVIDNGPGLPPERLDQLLTPGTSGKGGTHQGLGLSIVGELLGKWNASILCRSHPGTGTSFQLLVPAAESS